MTKKHFNSLALHLAYVRPEGEISDAFTTWLGCVRTVSDACALASPHFSRERFLDACRFWDVAIRNGELTIIEKNGVN